jgi:hypothetical protein
VNESRILKAALWYMQQGYSVIPVRPDKKPMIRWEPYQHQRANDAEIRGWWQKWPDANVGIVTGAISGIDVIDVDSEAGKAALDEFWPDSLVAPTCRTPSGGWHHYFEYKPGLVNRARVLTDCDVRTTGGYVVAPPSRNGEGKTYSWVEGCKINEIPPPVMPDFLHEILSQGGPPQSGTPACGIKNKKNTSIGDSTTSADVVTGRQMSSWGSARGTGTRPFFRLPTTLQRVACPPITYSKHWLFLPRNATRRFLKTKSKLKFRPR